MPHYLDPKTDTTFKKIFGERAKLLKSFLNAMLPLPEDGLIESLEYLSNEQAPEIPTFKHSIVDVRCTDQQGRIFIVEMQIDWMNHFMQRLLFSTSKAYVRQLQKGENYKLLNPVYGLGLLAQAFDKDSEEWYHHYKIINVKQPEREIKGLQWVFVEIPKFKASNLSQKKLQVLWLKFLKLNEKQQTVDPELYQVPEIKDALELLEESAYTPGELEAYDKYWDNISTEKTMMESREERGREAGMAVAKIGMAKKMFAKGMSLEQVHEITELSLDLLKTLNSTVEK